MTKARQPKGEPDGAQSTAPRSSFPHHLMEGERLARLKPTWPVQALDDLFNRARSDKGLAKELCRRVAKLAGLDDELVALLNKHIAAERNVTSAIKKKQSFDWDRYYGVLLSMYYIARAYGANERQARQYAAFVTQTGGSEKTDESIKNDLTKARRKISLSQIHPESLRAVAAREWPTNAIIEPKSPMTDT